MSKHPVRLAALAALTLTASALAQGEHVLEIARVAPGGDARTRTLPMTNLGRKTMVVVERDARVNEAAVRSARVSSQKQRVTSGSKVETRAVPVITLRFTPGGNQLLSALTKEWKGKQLAFIIDGKVISAPRVTEVFGGGELSVTGGFTREEADAIVAKINAAPRPEGVGELIRPSLFGSNRGPTAATAEVAPAPAMPAATARR